MRTGLGLMLEVCEQEQLSPAVRGCVSLVHSHPPFGVVIPEAQVVARTGSRRAD